MHALMSPTANTVLSFLIGFCIGAVLVGIHYGKKLIEQPASPKKDGKVIDLDESLRESIRYDWREKVN